MCKTEAEQEGDGDFLFAWCPNEKCDLYDNHFHMATWQDFPRFTQADLEAARKSGMELAVKEVSEKFCPPWKDAEHGEHCIKQLLHSWEAAREEIEIMKDWLTDQLGEWISVETSEYPTKFLIECREHYDHLEEYLSDINPKPSQVVQSAIQEGEKP